MQVNLRGLLVALGCGCLPTVAQPPSGVVIPASAKAVKAASLATAVRIYQGSLVPRLAPFVGDPQAVSTLVSMLEDENERLFWPPIVVALGYIAPYDSGLANRLVNYLESPRPFRQCNSKAPAIFRKTDTRSCAIPMDEYEPKVRALVALGFLLAKADMNISAAHRQYLSDAAGSNSNYLLANVRWTQKEKYLTATDRAELLVKFAKLGYKQSQQRFSVQLKPPIHSMTGIESQPSAALKH